MPYFHSKHFHIPASSTCADFNKITNLQTKSFHADGN